MRMELSGVMAAAAAAGAGAAGAASVFLHSA